MGKDKNPLDKLVELIPGFGGYVRQEKRREDDRLTREYLVRRLQDCKGAIEKVALPMVEKGQLDAVAATEKIRHQIELQQNRLRAAVEGYSSWFDKRQVDETLLEKIAEMDSDLVSVVDRLQNLVAPKDSTAEIDWKQAEEFVSLIKQRLDRRQATLQDGE